MYWSDVPLKYSTKSTIHRFHLYLAGYGIYQEIFFDLLQAGYSLQKVEPKHYITATEKIQAKKGDPSVLMAIRK